jgi:drug/metabolite transporter (DMT)-like permease
VALAFCLVALCLPPAPAAFDSSADVLPITLGVLLAVGISATVGQLFLTKAFAVGPPARVSVVALSQVVFGVAFDLWLWQRTLELMTLLGILLVMIPTVWVLLRREPVEVTEVAGDA